ncbi:autophagy protein 16 [Ostertagia ostertagi]
MEHRPSTSSGNFREEILRKLEARNANFRPWAAIFKNYSSISDELIRVRRRFDNRGSLDATDTTVSQSSSLELKQLREELAEVYKQKSRNDQSLIEANRKLDQHDAALNAVTKERDKLILENKKLYARISELECALKKTTDDKQSLYDEWIALSALLETKTNEMLQLQQERLVLINKIRDLNEQHANLFNTEVDLQQERQQRRIREEIARACEDISKDDKVLVFSSQYFWKH